MGACVGVRNGYVADAVDRELVIKGSVLAQNTAVTMGGVFAKADISNNKEGWEARSQQLNGLDDRTLRVVSSGAKGIFGTMGDGYTEENDRTKAFVYKRGEVRYDFFDATAVLVWEGRDQGFLVGLIGDEKWVDKHGLE